MFGLVDPIIRDDSVVWRVCYVTRFDRRRLPWPLSMSECWNYPRWKKSNEIRQTNDMLAVIKSTRTNKTCTSRQERKVDIRATTRRAESLATYGPLCVCVCVERSDWIEEVEQNELVGLKDDGCVPVCFYFLLTSMPISLLEGVAQ